MGVVVWRDLEDQTKPVEIHVQKVRFGECGGVGMAELYFDRTTSRYSETMVVDRSRKWVGASYET
jgi:twinkle protein